MVYLDMTQCTAVAGNVADIVGLVSLMHLALSGTAVTGWPLVIGSCRFEQSAYDC